VKRTRESRGEMPEYVIPVANERGVRVFVGGCVERGDGSSFRAQAHAHNSKTDPYFGWVCFRSSKRLFTASGAPSQLLLEEIAHILAPNQPHNATWIRRYKELGAPLARELKVRLANARRSSRKRSRKKRKDKDG